MPIVAKWFIKTKMAAQACGPPFFRPHRVLVVDDEPGAIPLLQALLHRHEVVSAESAVVALRMLDLDRFDVIVVDNWTRRISGLELLSYVAARHPHTRRILHTANRPETFASLQSVGVVEFFVAKPGFFMIEGLCDGLAGMPALATRVAS